MYHEINSEEYREQFASGKSGDYQFIDVREVDEYAAGHIPGTQNIPMSQIQQRLSEINPETPVILVCATGGRSAKVAEFMASMGYQKLYNHSDGTKGWVTKGYAVER